MPTAEAPTRVKKAKPKPIVLPCSKGDGKFWIGDGSEKDDARQRQLLAAAMFHLPDGPYEMEIRPYEEHRRLRANNFYWKAIDIVVQHERAEGIGQGWDKDAWHLKLAEKFNSVVLSELDERTGEIIERRYGLSTRKLSIERFSEYLEDVLFYFAEKYGLVITPTKSEDWREKGKAA
jgi:hypothetical protein